MQDYNFHPRTIWCENMEALSDGVSLREVHGFLCRQNIFGDL